MIRTTDYFDELGRQFSGNYNNFIKLIPNCSQFSKEDIKMIYYALHEAIRLHDGVVRKSGEPYVNHPISVASLLASYGFDATTICASLLHDTFEDTEYTEEECSEKFGKDVSSLIESVTKIGRNTNYETRNKIIERSLKDVRTIAIKSSDRLHNMFTLDALKPYKQQEISGETKGFYVPVSTILGIYQLRNEFQDLCLFYLDNDMFKDIYYKRNNMKLCYYDLFKSVGDKLQDELSKNGIAASYEYRIKNIVGISDDEAFKIKRFSDLNEIDNLFAISLYLDDEESCYKAFEILSKYYDVDRETLQDFIINPKESGYRAINCDIHLNGVKIGIRIATKEMKRRNALGIFANNPIEEKVLVYSKRKLSEFKETLKKE